MKSIFDPKNQINDVNALENKIIVTLERTSEIFRMLLWNQSKKTGLSPLQSQILLFVRSHSKDKSKISYLAQHFHITKATVSDTVKSLIRKEFVSKECDLEDKRSFVLSLTKKGLKVINSINGLGKEFLKPIGNLDINSQTKLLSSLMSILNSLSNDGVISTERMCFSCANYTKETKINLESHHCALLQKELELKELRIDCLEYLPN